MRLRVRHFSVATACLLASLWFTSCSSQQQDEADVQASGDSGEGDVADSDGAPPADETADTGQKDVAEGNTAATEGAAVAEGNGAQNTTEGDLKEIISEMNSNTPEGAADPSAKALAQNAAPQPAQEAPQEAPAPQAAPAPGPMASALPEMGSKMPYVVEHGDTLGKIAQKVYGNMGRWKDIATLTALANPSRIYPGDVVYYSLDDSSVEFSKKYETVQRSTETVQPGDTLAKIAKRVYGTSRSWKHIWRQNDGINNPDKLTAGTHVFYVQKGAISAEKTTKMLDKTVFNKKTYDKNSFVSSVDLKLKPLHKGIKKFDFALNYKKLVQTRV